MRFKKPLILLLVFCLMVGLAGCGGLGSVNGSTLSNDKEIAATAAEADTADKVVLLIEEIPPAAEVTTEDSNAIIAARTALNALPAEERAEIDEAALARLTDAETVMKEQESKGATTRAVGWIIEMLYKLTSLLKIPNYGLAIFLLTVILKIVLHPLIIKQQRSMKAMTTLQPKQAAIDKKYANNPQKKQEMIMKLYKEEGVSPFSSCLPLLAQMPIIMILFYGLRSFTPLFPEYYTFIWIPYLRLFTDATPLPWILPIGCALFTMAQQYMGTTNRKDMTQKIMLFMVPVMFLVFVRQVPSGLALYWLFYSLTSVLQMTYINWKMKIGVFAPAAEKPKSTLTIVAEQYDKEHPEEAAAREAKEREKARKKGKLVPPEPEPVDMKKQHTHNKTQSSTKVKDNRDKPWH